MGPKSRHTLMQDLQEEVRKLQRDILKDQDVPKAERQERLR